MALITQQQSILRQILFNLHGLVMVKGHAFCAKLAAALRSARASFSCRRVFFACR